MKLTVQEIGRMVNGKVIGDGSRQICGVAGLEEAGAQDLSFLKDVRQLDLLNHSQAGAILVPPPVAKASPSNGKVMIVVDHPFAALSVILKQIEKEKRSLPEGIHPTAIVHPTAVLGAGVSIGAYTIIEAEARIGAGSRLYAQCYVGKASQLGPECLLYPQVVIREDVSLGARCIVHSGTVLGADGYGYLPIEGRHQKIPQVGKVVIEDDVEIGANCTIDRATLGTTRIGSGTKIDNLVQVAHNVQIGPNCLIIAQAGIAGSSRLGKGVTLAGQVGVSDHIKIGDGAVVGPQGGVTSDVPAGQIYWGSPAQPHLQEKRQRVMLRKLPELLGKNTRKDKPS